MLEVKHQINRCASEASYILPAHAFYLLMHLDDNVLVMQGLCSSYGTL